MNVNDIIDYEDGEQDQEDTVAMFQDMINDGSVWRLQGSYGRTAMDMIRAGLCVLGEEGHRDYWGNYVPRVGGRYEISAPRAFPVVAMARSVR